MVKDQSTVVLRLLQGFLHRAVEDRHPQKYLILDLMRRIRQRQAQIEFEAMERQGKRLENSVDWDDIAF